MTTAEQPPQPSPEDISFDVQINEVNQTLGDRIPTFEEFTAAGELADQLDYDEASDTFTDPDGNFVDAEQAKQLLHVANESTWLLDDAQELAVLKAKHAVDDTLRDKAVAWASLDQSIHTAHKADAEAHATSLREERARHQEVLSRTTERTKELEWKTAFHNGGTRTHQSNPELRQWVQELAEDQATQDVRKQLNTQPGAEELIRVLDERTAHREQRRQDAREASQTEENENQPDNQAEADSTELERPQGVPEGVWEKLTAEQRQRAVTEDEAALEQEQADDIPKPEQYHRPTRRQRLAAEIGLRLLQIEQAEEPESTGRLKPDHSVRSKAA